MFDVNRGCVFIPGHPAVFGVCLFEDPQSPQKLGLSCNKNLQFLSAKFKLKFRNTGKLTPFVFGGANTSLKMRSKVS